MPIRDCALDLVQAHREAEPNLLRVILYADPRDREVRLLEVIDGSPKSGEALPCRFAPDVAGGVPFAVVVVELCPDEFEALEQGRLALPTGWVQEGRELLYAAA